MERAFWDQMVEWQGEGKKKLALLLDPDHLSEKTFGLLSTLAQYPPDLLLVGGSLLVQGQIDACIRTVRKHCPSPIFLFPGSAMHVSPLADGILFLSLLSGRNPELLIGQQVVAAPLVKQYGLEAISTAYLLVESGITTTAHYISQTMPLPAHKPEIAAATALAGEMLGMKAVYLDAGSGAARPVPTDMIRKVKESIGLPLIVGGGIRDLNTAVAAWEAGADWLVIGTAAEQSTAFWMKLHAATKDV